MSHVFSLIYSLRLLSRRRFAFGLAIALTLAISACGGPPTEALDAAEKSLLSAAWSEDCATETYNSAQRMLREAQEAAAAGRHDEAKRKAEAAQRLAEQAKLDAELNAEECERRKNALRAVEARTETVVHNVTATNETETFSLETIYFDFDESSINEGSRRTLDQNARWLLNNQTQKVRIEGHTDARGTAEYNIALSQRRGESVKRYLQTLGVDAPRMTVVGYGKERPAAFGDREQDHALNRRAEFKTH